MNYTIVEPGFEFFEPTNNYLCFLEACARVCYKSEDHIKEGSAEKILTKVVKEVNHLSVTEHANCIISVEAHDPDSLLLNIIEYVPLFALRSTIIVKPQRLLISGNIRMWMELLQSEFEDVGNSLADILHHKWPFFFNMPDEVNEAYVNHFNLLDDNPLTNKNDLSADLMKKHMALTCKLIGDRTMSHQLVRHRLAAYSQESQRYCDYGKKGFQFIIPPSYQGELREKFIKDMIHDYERYVYYREHGIKPEDARNKLPGSCKTEVVSTYTLGMWEHLFEHRARNPKAQWQIKDIMQGIEKKFIDILPMVFKCV